MTDTNPLSFTRDGSALIGIADIPTVPAVRGVLIVVGGPQYRVGSHRQFALLARELAANGIPSMRFDHRGIGDSEGDNPGFVDLDADINAAINAFFTKVPSLQEVVIWGLCDAASVALLYAPEDDRVTGIVLLNPWVRSEQSLARSYLAHYYTSQIVSREFWRRLFTGRLGLLAACGDFFRNLSAALRPVASGGDGEVEGSQGASAEPFQYRMEKQFGRFDGRALIILSGEDLTAGEFMQLTRSRRAWRKSLKRATTEQKLLAEANHTFSRQAWREQVSSWTLDWIRSW
jgi:exosortase A-associated hydrolase 1